MHADIGIIGGTGSVPWELLENTQEIKVHTPYGSPSDLITLGTFASRTIAILPRHGRSHSIQPSAINYRANIWALKELGVKRILAASAVGSLQERIAPGDFVFIDQFIDRTTKRQQTFYEGSKVSHLSMAEPICPELHDQLVATATDLHLPYHSKGTYVCIEGPRFSTKAESRLYHSWGGDIIGMTVVPECVLAREAEICYSSVAMVTDYDTFKDDETVTMETVLKTMKTNEEKVRTLLTSILTKIPSERHCNCKDALKNALI